VGVEKGNFVTTEKRRIVDQQDASDLVAKYGSIRRASMVTGIARRTLGCRLAQHRKRIVDFPALPSGEMSAEEIISRAKQDFARRRDAADARKWFTIKINEDKPIGVAFVGDPHVDNPGTDWITLDHDMTVLAKTPGMYAVNDGDLQDNWVGRLARLYADSTITRTQAGILARKMLAGYGVNWLAVLTGNHDLWSEGAVEIIKAMCAPEVPVLEWQAKFQLRFSNGRVCRIWAAHDFPGHSMWNENHGGQRAQKMREDAHIYAAGDKHTWKLDQGENTRNGQCYWLVRSRGYKAIDSYADVKGYDQKKAGATITAVIDPKAPEGPRFVHCYADVAEAAEFLTWKRKKS
jgi:hypothetical protein